MRKISLFAGATILLMAVFVAPSYAVGAQAGGDMAEPAQASQAAQQGIMQNAFLSDDLIDRQVMSQQNQQLGYGSPSGYGGAGSMQSYPSGYGTYYGGSSSQFGYGSPYGGYGGYGSYGAPGYGTQPGYGGYGTGTWGYPSPGVGGYYGGYGYPGYGVQPGYGGYGAQPGYGAYGMQPGYGGYYGAPGYGAQPGYGGYGAGMGGYQAPGVGSYYGRYGYGMQPQPGSGFQPGTTLPRIDDRSTPGAQRDEWRFDNGSQDNLLRQDSSMRLNRSQSGGASGAESSGVKTNFRPRPATALYAQVRRGGFLGLEQTDNVRVEELIGKPVRNQQGQQLGSVEDLMLGSDGQIRHLILSRGDLFGAADQLTAVPWETASPIIRPDAVIVSISQEQLNNTPQFSRNDLNRLQNPEVQQRIFGYYGTAQPTTGAFPGARANALIGELVTNPQGEELGVIRDLFADQGGCIKYMVLSPAEEMGMEDKLVAVPWGLIRPSPQRDAFVMDISPSRLRSAPSFTRENWRDFVDNPQFDQRVYSYFNVQPTRDLSRQISQPAGTLSLVRATQVIGEAVRNTVGQNLGTLEDLVTNDTGRIKYLLISRQEQPNQLVAVPWDAAAPTIQQNRIVIDVSQSRFNSAPSFTRNNLQQLDNPQWERRINTYFRTELQLREQRRGQESSEEGLDIFDMF